MNTVDFLVNLWPILVGLAVLFMTIGVLVYKVKRIDGLLFKPDGSLTYAKESELSKVREDYMEIKDHERICELNSMKVAQAVQSKLEETQLDMAEKIAEILKRSVKQES